MRAYAITSAALLVACGGNMNRSDGGAAPRDVMPVDGPGLAALPARASAESGRFMTHDRCAVCHSASPGVLTDSAGRDVSPPKLWRGSMMAMSGRDPYWLAALEHELTEIPRAREYIERTCTRCHTPAGAVATQDSGGRIALEDITRANTPNAQLAREGVTCTACHQITAENLGTPAGFTGGYTIGRERRIFGPHAAPFTMPMQQMVQYTPTQAAHMMESSLCASCHTVITRALDDSGAPVGPEFPEQVPYLEWRNSSFSTEAPRGADAASCQSCHMPTRDEDGRELRTVLSNRPTRMLSARAPIGRHTFAGGNAYMLSLLAAESGWTGAASTPEELQAGAALAERTLRSAATLTVTAPTLSGDAWTFDVRVTNTSGHRLPTAYPSRRMWLHVAVEDSNGEVRFESGASDSSGGLVTRDGRSLEDRRPPHTQTVVSEDEVAVYEAVMGDAAGRETHTLLRATRYLKDNRILPRGWSRAHPDARMTTPVGTDGDPDFVPGGDTVHYRVAASGWRPTRVRAELLFQTVPPGAVRAVTARGGEAATRLRTMTEAHRPTPRTIATASAP